MNHQGRPRLMIFVCTALVIGLATGKGSAQEPDLRVSVRVVETAGVARWASPVQVSVPLPSHAPADLNAFRLLADDGSEIATDRWAIARWHGSTQDTAQPIRWLGMSFIVDSAAHEVLTVTVVADAISRASATPAGETEATRTDTAMLGRQLEDGVYLNTGALSLRLPHTGTSLLDDLWVDLDGRPGVDAEMISADHGGGLLVANTSGAAPRWQSAGARLVRNGSQSAVARVDLISDTAGLGTATLWAEVGANSSWVKLTLSAVPAESGLSAGPLSVVLPVRTLGDPLQLGVRRGLDNEILEGPLPVDGTLFVAPDEQSWSGTLGDMRAEGLLPWAQMSTLTWSTAAALDTSSPHRGLRVGGNGALWFDLAPEPDSGATHATFFLESRRRAAPAERLADFDRPLVAVLPAEWYRQTRVMGPLPIPAPTAMAARSIDNHDRTLDELLRFVATGESEWFASARLSARRQLAQTVGTGLRGPALYAWLSGDAAAAERVRENALAALEAEPSGWQALDAIVAWEVTGDPRFLEHVRESLRVSIGAAWSADACSSATADPAGIAALVQATAQYVWVLRDQNRPDQAAENALFGMLDRLETCPPAHPSWSDTWSYAALLADDAARRDRWAGLAGSPAGPRRGQ